MIELRSVLSLAGVISKFWGVQFKSNIRSKDSGVELQILDHKKANLRFFKARTVNEVIPVRPITGGKNCCKYSARWGWCTAMIFRQRNACWQSRRTKDATCQCKLKLQAVKVALLTMCTWALCSIWKLEGSQKGTRASSTVVKAYATHVGLQTNLPLLVSNSHTVT